MANELGTSVAKLSIAWTIKNPNVSTTILGASKKEQLIENLKALDVVSLITPEVTEKIELILKKLKIHQKSFISSEEVQQECLLLCELWSWD